jgi:hypothetical protein
MFTDWLEELVSQINTAISHPGGSTIFVPNEDRKGLAENALKRMAPDRDDIRVEVKGDAIHQNNPGEEPG